MRRDHSPCDWKSNRNVTRKQGSRVGGLLHWHQEESVMTFEYTRAIWSVDDFFRPKMRTIIYRLDGWMTGSPTPRCTLPWSRWYESLGLLRLCKMVHQWKGSGGRWRRYSIYEVQMKEEGPRRRSDFPFDRWLVDFFKKAHLFGRFVFGEKMDVWREWILKYFQ